MFGLDDIISIGAKLLDKIIPDPKAASEAKIKLLELQQTGQIKMEEFALEREKIDAELAKGQIDINKIEAASENNYKSCWRPTIGWCCSLGLIYDFFIRPILTGLFPDLHFPELDSETILPLIISLLGLGTMRSFEKYHGKHK